MKKLKILLDKGWFIDLKESDGWYDVGATHNTWGSVSEIGENLSAVIGEVHRQAMEMHLD